MHNQISCALIQLHCNDVILNILKQIILKNCLFIYYVHLLGITSQLKYMSVLVNKLYI